MNLIPDFILNQSFLKINMKFNKNFTFGGTVWIVCFKLLPCVLKSILNLGYKILFKIEQGCLIGVARVWIKVPVGNGEVPVLFCEPGREEVVGAVGEGDDQ